MIYLDTSYLAKFYLKEPGTEDVLKAFARESNFVCGEHGRLELITSFKRHQREGRLSATQVGLLWEKHGQDLADGLIRFLPVSSELIATACQQMLALPPSVFVRAADALHLACAADAGLKEIYSHDRHLLAAAPHFKLKGIDVIPGV